MSNLLDRISELEQQIVELRAEVEKEEKENKRWRAKEGYKYWFVNSSGNPDWLDEYNRDIIDNFRYDTHNYFQTEEEARRYAKVLETERQLKKFADEHNDKIDWSNVDKCKYSLYYIYVTNCVGISSISSVRDARIIYFSSRAIAQQAIDEIGEEEIKEYLTYEW